MFATEDFRTWSYVCLWFWHRHRSTCRRKDCPLSLAPCFTSSSAIVSHASSTHTWRDSTNLSGCVQIAVHTASPSWTRKDSGSPGAVSINRTDGPTRRWTILQWTNSMGGWSLTWLDSPSCLVKQPPDTEIKGTGHYFFSFRQSKDLRLKSLNGHDVT